MVMRGMGGGRSVPTLGQGGGDGLSSSEPRVQLPGPALGSWGSSWEAWGRGVKLQETLSLEGESWTARQWGLLGAGAQHAAKGFMSKGRRLHEYFIREQRGAQNIWRSLLGVGPSTRVGH